MSLLLDALKKAEEAKRRRQAAELGEDPTPVTAPAPLPSEAASPASESDFPTLALTEQPTAESDFASMPLDDVPPLTFVAEAAPTPAVLPETAAPPPPAAAEDAGLSFALEPAPAKTSAIVEPSLVIEAAPPVPPVLAEVVAEPIVSSPQPAVEPVVAAPAKPAPASKPAAVPSPSSSEPAKLSPEATRQLFNSKQKPKRAAPSTKQRAALIGGVLVLGLLAAGGWLWWQMQGGNSSLTLIPPSATNEVTPTPAPAIPAGPVEAAAAPAKPSPSPTAQADLPPAAEAAPPIRLPVEPKPGDRAKIVEIPANVAAGDVHFVRDEAKDSVPRGVAMAYQAFQQGDYNRAADLYRQQLGVDGKSRDALLGLAAIAVKRQQLDEARALYRRILADNAHDEVAAGALASLSSDSDAEGAEGRLKALFNSQPNPDTATALGSVLAKQGRWQEAQDYYFKAHSAAPGEPDYAFNLAVALDALGERKLASEFYGKALNLAKNKAAGFDPEAARRRLAALGAN